MARRVNVAASKTFDESDDGTLQYVTAGSPVTLTIPNDSTGDFLNADFIEVFSNTDQIITIVPDSGVTLTGREDTIDFRYGYLRLERIDTNEWLAWNFAQNQRRDFVTANNEVSRSLSSFADALQKNFTVVEDATYKLGYVYQWRHEKKDKLHRVRVRVDGVENLDLRAYQYMGGQDDDTSVRMRASGWTLVDLTAGVFDIDFQFSSEDETAYLFYRRLFLERWSQ